MSVVLATHDEAVLVQPFWLPPWRHRYCLCSEWEGHRLGTDSIPVDRMTHMRGRYAKWAANVRRLNLKAEALSILVRDLQAERLGFLCRQPRQRMERTLIRKPQLSQQAQLRMKR